VILEIGHVVSGPSASYNGRRPLSAAGLIGEWLRRSSAKLSGLKVPQCDPAWRELVDFGFSGRPGTVQNWLGRSERANQASPEIRA
jgi:hypothetical protein